MFRYSEAEAYERRMKKLYERMDREKAIHLGLIPESRIRNINGATGKPLPPAKGFGK